MRSLGAVALAGLAMYVSGTVLAQQRQPAQPAGHQRMVRLLREVRAEAERINPFMGQQAAQVARDELATLPPQAPARTRFLMLMRLGDEELRLGNNAEAIRRFSEARDLRDRTTEGMEPSWPALSRFRLAVAYMRLGETANCELNPSAVSCILPLKGDAVHTLQDGSRQAIATFLDVLTREQNTPMSLSARWLLNIAYMTVGEYPEKVPAEHLIPPAAFESEERIPSFRNVAPALGLDAFNLSGSAIADDFDNDGDLDLLVSTWDPREPLRYYRHNQDGSFTERGDQAGLGGIWGGLNMVQADYNNDGHTDVLVLRGAWFEERGQYPNSLLRNNGNGTFTDVTFDAGLGRVHLPTQTGAWGDYDNDGDLDLFVGNESSLAQKAPSQLFRNNGNGTFTDVALEAGVRNDRYAKAAVWGDYNNDRWPDLYVSNYEEANRLYRNNGNGTFTDVAPVVGVTGPIVSFPAWFWDVDNDGHLDIFASSYEAGSADLAASILQVPNQVEMSKLYRGIGDGRFDEVARRYNLVRPAATMGSNFGDLDNDGFLDFYLGTGYPNYESVMPNVMYRNQGGRQFADVSTSGGFAHLQKGHGVVFADLDHDGDQDVFEQMGGAYPGDRARNVLYENPGFGNHWLTIKLVGVRSNRSAIGARIRAEVVEGGTRRSIFKHVNSGGSFGANPLRQTIGLGKATSIDMLEIAWPATGRTQTFRNVRTDRAVRLVEGAASLTPLTLRALPFKGGPVKTPQPHVH